MAPAGADMTDTWTIFGDPSLMVRTDDPLTMNVSHVPVLTFGSGQLTVSCDQDGARVAISNDYELLGTGIITGGSAVVTFTPVSSQDTLLVTVTAFNCIPAVDEVYIMPPGCWLGLTNEWNNPANWSDGVIPGPGSEVIIPEDLIGNFYPSDFDGADAVIDQLNLEEGANINIPVGVIFTVGGER